MSRRLTRWLLGIGAVILAALVAGLLLRPPAWVAPAPLTVSLATNQGTLEVAPTLGGVFLVLPDGTLWRLGVAGGFATRAAQPTRIGADADWAMAAGGNNGVVAIKRNGELWQAGWNGGTGPASRAFQRVGTETDWRWAARCDTASAALKQDGSLWTWGVSAGASSVGDPALPNRPIPTRVGTNTWRTLATDGSNYGFLGITAEGQLQAWGKPHQPGRDFPVPTPVHPDPGWVSVSLNLFLHSGGVLWTGPVRWAEAIDAPGNLQPALTNTAPGRFAVAGASLYEIRLDGSLWCHPRPHLPAFAQIPGGTPGRVGDRHDWVRLWHGAGTVVGLTADQTLWIWGTEPAAEPVPSWATRLKLRLIDLQNRLLRLRKLPPIGPGTTSATSRWTALPRPFLHLRPGPETGP